MKSINQIALETVCNSQTASRLALILDENQILALLNGVPVSCDISLTKFRDAISKDFRENVEIEEILSAEVSGCCYIIKFLQVETKWYNNPDFVGQSSNIKFEDFTYAKKQSIEGMVTVEYKEADKYGIIPILR